MSDFFQVGPELENAYTSNRLLQSYLKWRMGKEHDSIEPDLIQFGEKVSGPYYQWAREAETHHPIHHPYSPWGERTDEIETHESWQRFHQASAEEGLVAIGYKRDQGSFSRLYQFSKLLLFHPSSAFYTCPLAMADGAARVLELYGASDGQKKAFAHLTSRQKDQFWTSGQWMTERTGGSDVSQTSTLAEPQGNHYLLSGSKWFSSATTSEMALALAKTEDAGPLSLFFIEMRDSAGRLNGIQVDRLKDKLGTKALPTAELSLNGTKAELVGDLGKGVKTVASMLNITRLYNSICSLGEMDRMLQLATNYSTKRQAFGRKLYQHPLHVASLNESWVRYMKGFFLTFSLIELLGKEECGEANAEEKDLIRLLTPIAKLFTAKDSVAVVSEMLESFGGAGYVEDTGIPVHFRNAQVFPIWEGTTNILSLDVLRVMRKPEPIQSFIAVCRRTLETLKEDENQKKLVEKVHQLESFLGSAPEMSEDQLTVRARRLAMSLGQLWSTLNAFAFSEWMETQGQIGLQPFKEEMIRQLVIDLPSEPWKWEQHWKGLQELRGPSTN